jgi:hypothetical protein
VRPIVVLPALSLASLALAACSSTYHPEYHPVTVSNLAYPVMVNNGNASERAPTFIVPGATTAVPPAAVTLPAAPEQPPPGFFSHE